MVSLRIADVAHRSGFDHRGNVMPDGTVVYRLIGGTGSVALPRAKWDAIGASFELEIAPFRKRARRMSWSLFPAILVFAMTIGQIFPYTGILILLGIFGGPVAIYVWYSAKVQKAANTAEARLRQFPHTPAVEPPVGKIPLQIRLASFLFVGPYLIIAIIGEIGGPQTFRNTPFTGAHIGWLEIAAFGLIAFQLSWPMLAPRLRYRYSR